MTISSLESILDLAVEIQQIPAPTFSEGARAGFVEARFRREGLDDVWRDGLGNVLARLAGGGGGKPLILAAHLDTVFPMETELTVHRTPEQVYGPGIGDNSLGLAGLFGLVWEIRARSLALAPDLILTATVGEEGLGNSRGMQAVVDRYADQALAYVAVEGMALGHIFNRGMGVRRYKVTYRTKGGHSWVDFGVPSAVHEISRLVSRLSSLQIPESPRTSWNAGLIQGGTSVNVIAAEASVQLDLRSEDQAALSSLEAEVTQAARSVPPPGVEVEVELIGQRPMGSIPDDHPFVCLAQDSLRSVGIEPHLSIGSTDASIPLHRGLPAVCIGLTTGSGTHSLDEYIDVAPLGDGMEQLLSLVAGAHGALA
ncbi:MAG TPA: M20/M25/M40 family metallo-hydrolase [Anaerolineales bacterium]|nr:M20/M25/M40 family metallo-hydrolase [Anaerolineales bacterium]